MQQETGGHSFTAELAVLGARSLWLRVGGQLHGPGNWGAFSRENRTGIPAAPAQVGGAEHWLDFLVTSKLICMAGEKHAVGKILPLQVGAAALAAGVGAASDFTWGGRMARACTVPPHSAAHASARKRDPCPAAHTCQSRPASAKPCPWEQQGPAGRGARHGMTWHSTLTWHGMAWHGTLTRATGGRLHPVGVPGTLPALPPEPPVFARSRVALGEEDRLQFGEHVADLTALDTKG